MPTPLHLQGQCQLQESIAGRREAKGQQSGVPRDAVQARHRIFAVVVLVFVGKVKGTPDFQVPATTILWIR